MSLQIYIHTDMCTLLHIYQFTYIAVCTYVLVYLYASIQTYITTYMHVHLCLYAYTHTHTYIHSSTPECPGEPPASTTSPSPKPTSSPDSPGLPERRRVTFGVPEYRFFKVDAPGAEHAPRTKGTQGAADRRAETGGASRGTATSSPPTSLTAPRRAISPPRPSTAQCEDTSDSAGTQTPRSLRLPRVPRDDADYLAYVEDQLGLLTCYDLLAAASACSEARHVAFRAWHRRHAWYDEPCGEGLIYALCALGT